MCPDDERGSPGRKRRTRGHIIEDLSRNYLEHKVLLNGHVLEYPAHDYGVDATMFHFADNGEIENGEVRFQLKATDSLKVINDGTAISFPVETAHLHHWALEIYPFILVVFEAKVKRAFWLHIQEYVTLYPDSTNADQEELNVHIPVSNKLTVKSIKSFRNKSLQLVDTLRNQGGFPDVGRKPR